MGTTQNQLTDFLVSKNQFPEQTSPYKVCLLILVEAYVAYRKQHAPQLASAVGRQIALQLFNLCQRHDCSPKELMTMVRHDHWPPELIDEWFARLRRLWDDGADFMSDVLGTEVQAMMADTNPVIKRSSVVGIFARQQRCWYERASFTQIGQLCKRSRHYLQGLFDASTAADVANVEESVIRCDMSVHRALSLLKDMLINSGPVASLDAKATLAETAKQLRSVHPHLHAINLLDCAVAAEQHDFGAALRSLHDYFDKTMQLDKSNPSCRQAALCAARLCRLFDLREHGETLVGECISLAEQTGDESILQHAFIEAFLLKGNEPSVHELIGLLLANAERAGAEAKQAFGYASQFAQLYDVQLRLERCCVFEAADAIDELHKCLAAVTAYTNADDPDVCRMCRLLRVTTLALLSGAYLQHGAIDDAALYAQHALLSSTSERLHKADAYAAANLASVHAIKGDFQAAFALLDHYDGRTHAPHLAFSRALLDYDYALLTADLHDAETLCRTITAHSREEADLRLAELARIRGDFAQALAMLQPHEAHKSAVVRCKVLLTKGRVWISCNQAGNALHALNEARALASANRLLRLERDVDCQLARVQLLLDQPDAALGLLSDTPCVQCDMEEPLYVARRSLLLAQCYLAQYAAFPAMLRRSTPPVTPTKQQKRGSAHAAAAAEKEACGLRAVQCLVRAGEQFKALQAFECQKEVLFLLSNVYHELGNEQQRNRCAHQFKLLDSNRAQYGFALDAIL